MTRINREREKEKRNVEGRKRREKNRRRGIKRIVKNFVLWVLKSYLLRSFVRFFHGERNNSLSNPFKV